MQHPIVSHDEWLKARLDLLAKEKEFTELFDKYNLMSLPVVNEEGKLAGVITADDVIALLRHK